MVALNLTPVHVHGAAALHRFADLIPAGFPSAAEGYEDEPLNLHDLIVRHPAATHYMRVGGDALSTEEHIPNGSLLVIDRAVPVAVGKLIVIEQSGGFVVTRLRQRPATPLRVWGVVVGVILWP